MKINPSSENEFFPGTQLPSKKWEWPKLLFFPISDFFEFFLYKIARKKTTNERRNRGRVEEISRALIVVPLNP